MKHAVQNSSRRQFLRQSGAFAALGTGAPIALNLAAMGSAAAQTASSGYKALVCIFLAGGNDSYNTVLPTDPASWLAYTKTRTSIALPQTAVRALSPVSALTGGRTLALHPQLAGLQNLFNNQRRVAVMGNVGTLVEPLTKDDYTRQLKRQPAKLFSHNDQQSTWQALAPEGASVGWGGRLADLLASYNDNGLFTGVSVAGNAVWVSGKTVKQYQMQASGALRIGTQTNSTGMNHIYGHPQVNDALQRIVTTNRTASPFESDLTEVARRNIAAGRAIGDALPAATVAPYGPSTLLQYTRPDGTRATNPLAQQLQLVARTIGARQALGTRRQVFFVTLGGFDTHDDQLQRHADLMARLDHAMVYFDTVLNSMGLANDVTTFTASDFGRTFTSNGDGTDHGWGGHHFVMGGAVQGGTVVGEIPVYGTKNLTNNLFDSSGDQLANGVMLPKISVEQYGAALGRWFGAGDAVNDIFPNLRNFSTNVPLMKA